MTEDARTGSLVKALAEGVRDDLGDVATALESAKLKVETLGESARAINGLGSECAGWANHLTSVIAEVRKEMAEVPAKLLGTPINPITTHVDPKLAAKVKAAKEAA